MASSTTPGANAQTVQLTERGHFNRWWRAFKVAAKENEVLDLFIGAESVLEEPDLVDLHEAFMQSSNVRHETMLRKYNIAYDEWVVNNKLVKIAGALLAKWVDSDDHDKICDREPLEAIQYLRDRYEYTDSVALEIAEKDFAELNFDPSEPVRAFIHKVQMIQEEIVDAKGTCSDATVMNKITRSLPYNGFSVFLFEMQSRNHNPYAKPIPLDEFIGRVVYQEACYQKWTSRKKVEKRPKCTFEPCGKWGHAEDECEMKNSRLPPGNDTSMGDDSTPEGDEGLKKGSKVDLATLRRQFNDLEEQLLELEEQQSATEDGNWK
ncbi:hypothetical protein LTR10_014631 [Elasticomyces elasticus]|uniref:CCHC-type domain-containing protein n=1 Tax=Exophiala sideris TaxID=1016849 RepID=A0ABR0JTJ3_9EURO|nr:hypothetical protein LTR10_014631 [Elasticomyces elasticus]KAK5040609.1 hypothetical protein LTS07_001109 [Exophiala sideris]KAK5042967.1 hypothetical protein LTR13_000737 [Exophiala sideris]KAK5068987.1 hypothetical protein LTR69_001110 [Exophiala sideris]KAK5186584.1 hypothetical protein LTR44_001641 [Eurotiomycetes sp. CCFEE 6388]